MLDKTDSELCSLITNVCKPPKEFDFTEAGLPCRFVWYEEFPWVCYFWWEDKTHCLPCVLFGHKNVEKSLQKRISKMANSSKNIQKTSKCFKMFQRKHTKRGKYCDIDLHPPPFLKREGGGGGRERMKILKT